MCSKIARIEEHLNIALLTCPRHVGRKRFAYPNQDQAGFYHKASTQNRGSESPHKWRGWDSGVVVW